MARDFVVSVMARDRVGIVAGLTEAVVELGGNIGALSQTVLEGHFTIIVTVRLEDETDMNVLIDAIRAKGAAGELQVTATEKRPGAMRPIVAGAERFVLILTGPDQKGIIRSISSFLAGRDINIEDLYAYTEGERFMLTAELGVPPTQELERLLVDLEGLWPETDMRLSIQHENIFLATNHVDFRHTLS